MQKNGAYDRRALVLLAVALSHAALLFMILRASRLSSFPEARSLAPLSLLILPKPVPPVEDSAAHPAARAQPRAMLPSRPPASRPDAAAENAITVPPIPAAPPLIDWQQEMELSAQNNLSAAERERNYRDLSKLSPEQLRWVRENHMVPAAPGIQWTHPRVEFDKNSGLPIVWINDHCVLVVIMVFCAIGHIEPNGHLFDHMHDQRN